MSQTDDPPAGRTEGPPAGNADRRRTYWLTRPDSFALPRGAGEAALLTLQSLLVHGPLEEDALARTLPGPAARHAVPALLQAEMLVREGATLRVNPAAYPDVRSALSDAGFNMDRL